MQSPTNRARRWVPVLLLLACDAAAPAPETPPAAETPVEPPASPVAPAAVTPPPAPSVAVGPSAADRVLDASARGAAALLEPPVPLGDDAKRAAQDVLDAGRGLFATPSDAAIDPPAPETPAPKSPDTPKPKPAKPDAPKVEPPPPKVEPPPPKVEPVEPTPAKPNPSGRNLAKLVGDRIQMKTEVQFEIASAKLTAGTSALLDDVALVMLASGKSFCVEGHTAATGSDAYNLKLSQRRASAVRKALLQRTVPDGRIDAEGFGELCPIADNETEEGRSKNSRIEIATSCECK